MPLLRDHHIFTELDITRTVELGVDPFSLTLRSDRPTAWKCSHNAHHTWESTPNRMTRRNYVCPECPRPTTTGTYLSTTPLYAEINHGRTAAEGINPLLLLTGSGKKIWWDCTKDKSHPSWQASVTNRSKGKGCPQCYSTCPMLIQTSLYGEVNHPKTLTEGINAEILSAGSNQKIWWNCSKDKAHPSWKAEVNGRRKGRGCPKCSGSKTEDEFRKIINEKSQYSFVAGNIQARWSKREMMQVDMLDATNNVIIEYDSMYAHGENVWHHRTAVMGVEIDMRKTMAALEAGYTIIRIRETPLPNLPLKHHRFHQVSYTSGEPKSAIAERCIQIVG